MTSSWQELADVEGCDTGTRRLNPEARGTEESPMARGLMGTEEEHQDLAVRIPTGHVSERGL